jgi:hypothetical protein
MRSSSRPARNCEFATSCIQTLPYGGTTKEIYWKLLDLGLMSFATDHPDVTRDAVKAYYE